MTLITIPHGDFNISVGPGDENEDLEVRIDGRRTDGFITFDFTCYLYTDITIEQATQIRDSLTAAIEAAEEHHPDKGLRNEFADTVYECSYDDLSVTGQETIRRIVEKAKQLQL